MEILKETGDILLAVKEKRPLVHHITNIVTINDCANIVLAIGGSPIMANDPAEAAEVTSKAAALVLNMGTPSFNSAEAMIIAGKAAGAKNIPIVFDPVGVGSTTFRKNISERLLNNVKPTVIRGNLSEIKYLAGLSSSFKGVDSGEASGVSIDTAIDIATDTAKKLAKSLKCIVALTGKKDIVTDGEIAYVVNNGSEALSRVTGTGCMVSSLAGTFCGATGSYLAAALGGVLTMGIAGQLAYAGLAAGEGIGTFKVRLFDKIFNLEAETFIKEGKVEIG